MAEEHHPNLPKAYGPAQTSANCANCMFMYSGNLCSYWKVVVEPAYVCAKWQSRPQVEK